MHKVYDKQIPRTRRQSLWKALIAAFEASGQQYHEFATAKGLKVADLRRWRYRLNKQAKACTDAFVPINIVSDASHVASSFTLHITRAGDYRITFPDDFNKASLQRLLTVLDKGC